MTGRNFALPVWISGGVLFLATLLACQPAWHAGYIWDDDVYVTQNELLTAPDGLRRIWFSLDSPSQYFPLTYTTFRIEHALWGLNPTGYHVVNVLLHAVNALLLWRLLVRLQIPGAWLAAAIFALHPVQVESVAWITERKNVLMGIFFLLALRAWTEFVDERTKRPWLFYSLALVLYALALFSKTTACTLPAALLLILWLKKKPIAAARLLQIVPFVALGVAMGLVTIWWERFHQGTHASLFAFTPLDRLLIASRAIWFYLGKLLWPADLVFSYPLWTIDAGDAVAYLPLAGLVALAVALFYARRKLGRGAEVAALFFVATLAPVLGFIMLYTFRYSFVADHYQYLAAIGPIALFAAGCDRLVKRVAQPPFGAVINALPLAVLGVLTWRQCLIYVDDETLNRATIAKNPRSWMAHNNLGSDLVEKGRIEEALRHFADARAINPTVPDPIANTGAALVTGGNLEGALQLYRQALSVAPENAESHYNLATVLRRTGAREEAIAHFREAIRLRPRYATAHNNLGIALHEAGEFDEAFAHFAMAVEINPRFAGAHNNLGVAWQRRGRRDEAIAHFRAALEIKPDFVDARRNLENAEARQGR